GDVLGVDHVMGLRREVVEGEGAFVVLAVVVGSGDGLGCGVLSVAERKTVGPGRSVRQVVPAVGAVLFKKAGGGLGAGVVGVVFFVGVAAAAVGCVVVVGGGGGVGLDVGLVVAAPPP
ncbi:hypothetical protein, partial [Streptomyces sp. SP18CM02]|uniref:hypothetical protein n=1 Tax=Streptomyces sp. SP18CM02 TaxID=2758571 RepID=UPI001CC29787